MSALSLVQHPRTTLLLEPRIRAGQPGSAPSGIARHVDRVAAWSRLEDELRSIAVDLLGLSAPDELPAASADWVAATTDAAISGLCEAALDGLVRALDSLLRDVPADVARQLHEARVRHDAGFI